MRINQVAVSLGLATPGRQDHKGRPLLIEMPRRVELMEHAAPLLFDALRTLSVTELKSLRPTSAFIPLIDALIDVRTIMGGVGA